jgi:hypothetical protein
MGCRAEISLRAGDTPVIEVSAMEGAASSPNPGPTVRRAFEFCRLEPQLLALAYAQLLPIIRTPTTPRLTGATRLAGVCSASQPSFQEEQDLEKP